MSPAAEFSSQQLKEIMEDNRTMDKGAWEIQEQVQHGEEVFDPGNSSSVLRAELITINNRLVSESGEEAVSLPNAWLNFQPMQTNSQAISIQSQACQEPSFWHGWFRQYG